MASLYTRRDSKELWLACYPKLGKLVRASLATGARGAADQILEKVELLLALERLRDVPVPEKILSLLEGLPRSVEIESPTAKDPKSSENLRAAIRAYVIRSAAGNVHSSLNNKLSQLRQFFGSPFIDEVDPRPLEHRRHARRRESLTPWFKGTSLAEITPDVLLTFLHEKKYGRSSKRHYRELFHNIFRGSRGAGSRRRLIFDEACRYGDSGEHPLAQGA